MTNRSQKSKFAGVIALVAIVTLLILGLFGAQILSLLNIAHAQGPAVVKTHSGLVVADPLVNTSGTWTFWGDALAKNATYSHTENSSGLYLGVQSPNGSEWAGYYAANPAGNADVYHATLTLPYSRIENGSFNTGLYVQTTINPINYIACGAGVNDRGYYWQVVIGTGNPFAANNYQQVYYQWLNNQSLTQECTIITNGTNSLTVYLGNTEVYSNSSLNLQIPPPFTAYLAVETTSPQMLYGSYTDFYATLGSTVTVLNAPNGDTVSIVDSSNRTIVSTIAHSSSTLLQLPANSPLPNGYIRVYDQNGTTYASTLKVSSFWGGDVYTVKSG